jgi:hypothetical protein
VAVPTEETGMQVPLATMIEDRQEGWGRRIEERRLASGVVWKVAPESAIQSGLAVVLKAAGSQPTSPGGVGHRDVGPPAARAAAWARSGQGSPGPALVGARGPAAGGAPAAAAGREAALGTGAAAGGGWDSVREEGAPG